MKKPKRAKPKLLQVFTFYDYSDVFIEFGIKTNKYSKEQITKMIGLKAERAWDKGEKYIGRWRNPETKKIEKVERTRSFGLWIFSTKGLIKKNRFEDHARCLLRRLEKNKMNIKKLLKEDKKVFVSIFVYLKIDKKQDYYGIGADSKLLKELINYTHYFEWRRDPTA